MALFSRILTVLVLTTSPSLVLSTPHNYRWPDERIDHLESILYQHVFFDVEPIGPFLFPDPCEGTISKGRSIGAEWIRTAYHDMATANVASQVGGIDASIGFETGRSENPGKAFNATLVQLTSGYSVRSSMADLIAIGATIAAASCSNGALMIPYRAGRIDATGPGPTGVPDPAEDIVTHKKTFDRQGFNVSEMIALVACGHSVGGVHGVDFPQIVDVVNDPKTDDNTQNFDGTPTIMDNVVASQFVNNKTQNPLAYGHNTTTNSDFRIFTADGGDMISRMAASNEFFLSTCQSLLERMVNTVPRDVTLTEVITPIAIKPGQLYSQVNQDGTMTLSGYIRILDDTRGANNNRQVRVHLRPRSGVACSDNEPCSIVNATTGGSMFTGTFYANGPFFRFYTFQATIPASQGVSSFLVEVTDQGNTTIYDNGGEGFPWDDSILPQLDPSMSCLQRDGTTQHLKLTVAVLDDKRFNNISFMTAEPYLQPGSVVPKLVQIPVQMSKSGTVSGTGYSLYTGTFTTPDHGQDVLSSGVSFDVERSYDIVANGISSKAEGKFFMWKDIKPCA